MAEQNHGARCAGVTAARVPPGVLPAGAGRQFGVFPPVPVRCRSQPADAAPRYSRSRFSGGLGEVGGALGDLGTFLPYVIAVITVAGMNPTGVLVGFGLFYLAAGTVFGVPMGVQPMKAVSTVVLVQHLSPGEIAGAGFVIGAFFLVAGASGWVTRLAKVVPRAVTAGIQLGLGASLALLGVGLLAETPWIGVAVAAVMLVLLGNRQIPAVFAGLAVGIALTYTAGLLPPFPEIRLGIYLPHPVWPTWDDVVQGARFAAVPQIPLTLANAIIVTAAITRDLFPKELHGVNERTLALSTGIGNLLAALIGGYPMCHGASGIAAHYRFGARSATAPALLGIACLLLGLFLGDDATAILSLIPPAVLGALLVFSGLELASPTRTLRIRGRDRLLVLGVAGLAVTTNVAIAFVAGLALALIAERLGSRPR